MLTPICKASTSSLASDTVSLKSHLNAHETLKSSSEKCTTDGARRSGRQTKITQWRTTSKTKTKGSKSETGCSNGTTTIRERRIVQREDPLPGAPVGQGNSAQSVPRRVTKLHQDFWLIQNDWGFFWTPRYIFHDEQQLCRWDKNGKQNTSQRFPFIIYGYWWSSNHHFIWKDELYVLVHIGNSAL